METISNIITLAAGYVLKAITESEAAKDIQKSLLQKFWQWIRPIFKSDRPTEEEIISAILERIKDEEFFKELQEKVAELQKAGIHEKNIYTGNIRRVKKIRIGDREYNPDDTYDRKNIFNGDVEDADEFILGDG